MPDDRPLDAGDFATGLQPQGTGKDAVIRRVQRWRFDLSTKEARVQHESVRAAVTFLRPTTTDATGLAVRAVLEADG